MQTPSAKSLFEVVLRCTKPFRNALKFSAMYIKAIHATSINAKMVLIVFDSIVEGERVRKRSDEDLKGFLFVSENAWDKVVIGDVIGEVIGEMSTVHWTWSTVKSHQSNPSIKPINQSYHEHESTSGSPVNAPQLVHLAVRVFTGCWSSRTSRADHTRVITPPG